MKRADCEEGTFLAFRIDLLNRNTSSHLITRPVQGDTHLDPAEVCTCSMCTRCCKVAVGTYESHRSQRQTW